MVPGSGCGRSPVIIARKQDYGWQAVRIEAGTRHRLSNETEEPLVVIEVQTGDYLGEDDEVRYDDIYNRQSNQSAGPAQS